MSGKKSVIGDSKRLFLEKEAIVAKAVMPLLTTQGRRKDIEGGAAEKLND